MSPRFRLMTGLVTTLTLLILGGLLIAEHRGWVAYLLLGMGVFRGVFWARELWYEVTYVDEE